LLTELPVLDIYKAVTLLAAEEENSLDTALEMSIAYFVSM